MVEVEELFVGRPCVTRVWISQRAREEIRAFTRTEQPRGFFVKKLEEYARNGFRYYVGNTKPVRREWDEVYRIGSRRSLFRALGFFDAEDFIVIDAYLKRGQALRASDRERIEAVAKIKSDRSWWRKGS